MTELTVMCRAAKSLASTRDKWWIAALLAAYEYADSGSARKPASEPILMTARRILVAAPAVKLRQQLAHQGKRPLHVDRDHRRPTLCRERFQAARPRYGRHC